MSNKAFFLLFCAVALNQIFVSAQSDLVVCNATNPGPGNVCTLEYNPVCAYRYVCIEDFECLGTTIGNSCQACEIDGYDYYLPGACDGDGNGEEEEVPGEEEQTEGGEGESGDGIFWCSALPVIPEVCTMEYNPVCAYSTTEEGSTSGVTVGNGCMACLEGYDYYTEGACTDDTEGGEEGPTEEVTEGGEEGPTEEATVGDIVWCANVTNPGGVCSTEYDPVCAYHDAGDFAIGTTAGNACQACFQQGFDYYTPGACETGNEENGGEEENENAIFVCEAPSEFPTEEVVCTLQYDPVCAYRAGEESSQGTTVGNSCQACFIEGFDYYTQGPCEGDEEEEDGENVIIVDPTL